MAHYEQGYYECQISDQGFDVSKEKKTPCFWLRFMPEGGEYEREVKLWLTDKTIESAVSRLRSLGWEGNSFRDLEPGGHSFAGTVVRLRCEHSQDGDKVYENWEFPAPESNSENKNGVAKKLDTLFAKALKGGKSAAKAVPAVVEDDGDIPF